MLDDHKLTIVHLNLRESIQLKEVEVRSNLRDRAIIYTLLYTGLRVGGLVSPTRDDVRLSERKGMITVRVYGLHVV